MSCSGIGSGESRPANGRVLFAVAEEDARVRVLIVDDQQAFRESLKVLLDGDGAVEVVGVAGSGQEGVDLAASCQADVVLMDMRMPGMNGIEAMELIHRAKAERLVIVLSAHTEEEIGGEVFAAGADGFLTKCHIENFVSAKIRELVAAADPRAGFSRKARTSARHYENAL
jgi:DNA-binding NarL/FixJ family response regulator